MTNGIDQSRSQREYDHKLRRVPKRVKTRIGTLQQNMDSSYHFFFCSSTNATTTVPLMLPVGTGRVFKREELEHVSEK